MTIEDRMVGKTIERVDKRERIIYIYFTDGTSVEIEAHTTEEGWISIDDWT